MYIIHEMARLNEGKRARQRKMNGFKRESKNKRKETRKIFGKANHIP